jgi:hypothetical protein
LLIVYGLVYVSRDYLSPLAIYSYIALLTFGFRGVVLLAGWDEFFTPFLLRKDLATLLESALQIFIVSHVAVLMGYLGLAGTARRLQHAIPRMGGSASIGRLMLVTTGLTLATLVVQAASVLGHGGVGESVVAHRSGEGSHMLNHVAQFSLLFLGVATLACVMSGRRGVMVYVGGLFAFVFVLNIPGGDRSALLVPFVIIALARHMSGRPLNKVAIVGVFAAIIVASAALDDVRGSVLRQQGGIESDDIAAFYGEEQQRGWGRTVTKGLNLQTLDYFLVVLQDFDYENLVWGEHFVAGLAGVIPRAIWPSKPDNITPGQWFRERYVPQGKAGRPFTSQGVYWVNFGIVGVFVGYFFTGLLLRIVTERIRSDRSVFGGGFGAIASLFLLNTGIASVFPLLVAKWLVPYLICVGLSGMALWRREPSAQSDAGGSEPAPDAPDAPALGERRVAARRL